MASCVSRAGEQGGVCSGRGVCVVSSDNQTAACNCELPFASVGDFATDPSVDCSIHFTATRVLWGVCSFISFLGVLYCCRIILISLRRGGIVSKASAMIPGQRSIGIDWITTSFFAVGSSAFWLSSTYLNFMILRVSIKQVGRFSPAGKSSELVAIRILARWTNVVIVLTVIACFMVFGFLVSPGNDQIFASLHFLILGFALATNGAVGIFAITPLVKQIDEILANNKGTVDNSKVITTKRTFVENKRATKQQVTFQAIVAFLFGAVPVITRKAAYWIPIAWSGAAIAMIQALSAWLDTTSKSSTTPGSDTLVANSSAEKGTVQTHDGSSYLAQNPTFRQTVQDEDHSEYSQS